MFYTSYMCTILDGAKILKMLSAQHRWHHAVVFGIQNKRTSPDHVSVMPSLMSSTQIAVLHFSLAHASPAIRVSPSIPLHTGYPLLFIRCFLKCHESFAPSRHLRLKKSNIVYLSINHPEMGNGPSELVWFSGQPQGYTSADLTSHLIWQSGVCLHIRRD